MAFTSRLALYTTFIAAAGWLGTAQADNNQMCWFPDGVTESPPDVPCNSANGPGTKACCGPNAFCMDNGFCMEAGVVSRGSCTDKTWGTDCPQHCITADDCPVSGGCTVNSCDFTKSSFTCGATTNGNCPDTRTFVMPGGGSFLLRPGQLVGFQTNDSALAIAPDTTLSTLLQVSSSNTTGNTTSSSNATSSSPTNSSGASSAQFSTGAVAGAALGTGIPLLIALLAAILMIVRQKRQLNAARAMPAGHYSDAMQSQQAPPYAPNEAPQHPPKPFGYEPQSGYPAGPLPMQQQQTAPTYSHFREQLHSPAVAPAEMDGVGERHELDPTVKHELT